MGNESSSSMHGGIDPFAGSSPAATSKLPASQSPPAYMPVLEKFFGYDQWLPIDLVPPGDEPSRSQRADQSKVSTVEAPTQLHNPYKLNGASHQVQRAKGQFRGWPHVLPSSSQVRDRVHDTYASEQMQAQAHDLAREQDRGNAPTHATPGQDDVTSHGKGRALKRRFGGHAAQLQQQQQQLTGGDDITAAGVGFVADPKAEVGRATWTLLHTLAAQFPDNPTWQQQRDARALINLLTRIYPCGECARHFGELVRARPVTPGSGRELRQWVCAAHNSVNMRLGKQAFDCSQIEGRWPRIDCGDEGVCELRVGRGGAH